MRMTDSAHRHARRQRPSVHGTMAPSTATTQAIAANEHQEDRGTSTVVEAMPESTEQSERVNVQQRKADALASTGLFVLLPAALIVVFALFAIVIAWTP